MHATWHSESRESVHATWHSVSLWAEPSVGPPPLEEVVVTLGQLELGALAPLREGLRTHAHAHTCVHARIHMHTCTCTHARAHKACAQAHVHTDTRMVAGAGVPRVRIDARTAVYARAGLVLALSLYENMLVLVSC